MNQSNKNFLVEAIYDEEYFNDESDDKKENMCTKLL